MPAKRYDIPSQAIIEEAKRKLGESKTFNGKLRIDFDEGMIIFTDGVILIRITHLRTPLPHDGIIDIVALAALTSYTPGHHSDEQPESTNRPRYVPRRRQGN